MQRQPPPKPAWVESFTPALVTALKEGYGLASLRADVIAGLTVAIVAVPLSMAFAIASGLPPAVGLFTAIVGGFLVSALGGSRYQIGGPAGAFIVLIFGVVQRQGYDGLVLATVMAGLVMMVVGLTRCGTYIRYIPHPVTVGFTAGIATIIFASQIKELLGLTLPTEPAALIPKLIALAGAITTVQPVTAGISLLAVALILGIRRARPSWPGMLIAVAVCAALTAVLHLNVATIGTRFGGMPSSLPVPVLPHVTLARLRDLLPDALALALLGSIESLLSAVVADGMTGRRHRSNGELVAQGIANIAAASFGGMPVTGTVARTATNVRAGGRTPVSGMLHAVFILLFMLVAAPLATYIPLASLGAVLAVVAWNMAGKAEFVALLHSRGDALVLLATFLLTVFYDLTTGIAVGVTLGAFLFLHRMAEAVEVQTGETLLGGDGAGLTAAPFEAQSDVMVYRISGALFFAATANLSTALDRIGPYPRGFILDMTEVPLLDATAARVLVAFLHGLQRAGTRVWIAGARPSVQAAFPAGLAFAGTVADARRLAAGRALPADAGSGRKAVHAEPV